MKTGKISAIMLLTTILFSCSGNSTSQEKANVEEHELTKPSSADAVSTICYSLKNGEDTVLMKLNIDDGRVSGDLTYDYFEKDRNSGTLKGQMNGDTLFATYTFMSEAKESVRQVTFLKNGDEMTEGYGNLNPTSGESDFTDKSAIKFDNKFVLKKTSCR